MRRGDRWHSAHRDHAYQRAVRSGLSHATVTSSVLVINLALGLAAIAVFAAPRLLLPMFVVSGVLLGLLYLWVERIYPLGSDRLVPAPGDAGSVTASADDPAPVS